MGKKVHADVWYCYVAECKDGTYYTGVTKDPRRRLSQHNGELPGGSRYCLGRNPVRFVCLWEYKTRGAAQKVESSLRRFSHEQKESLLVRSGAEYQVPEYFFKFFHTPEKYGYDITPQKGRKT